MSTHVVSLLTRILPDGTTIEMGRASMQGGQQVGSGWAVVRINGGEWLDVDFSPGVKLKMTIDACTTREEVEAFVIDGSQYPPFCATPKKGR
jgi:hypothetical protein